MSKVKVGQFYKRVKDTDTYEIGKAYEVVGNKPYDSPNNIRLKDTSCTYTEGYFLDRFELFEPEQSLPPANYDAQEEIYKLGLETPEERKSMIDRMVKLKYPMKDGSSYDVIMTEEEAINLYSDLKGALGGLV